MNNTPPEYSPSTRAADLQSPSTSLRNATGRRLQVAGTGAIALLAAALLCAPPTFAQTKSEPTPVKPAAPAPPTPPTPPTPPAAPLPPRVISQAAVLALPTATAPRKLEEVHFGDCALHECIANLNYLMQKAKLETMNIIFGPDTRDIIVPEVKLRNVSGPDVLQIIAAVAECTVEPMFSTDAQTAPPVAMLPGMSGVPAGRPASAVIGYMFRAKPKPNVQMVAFADRALALAAGRAGPATSPTARLTRIYPLGVVNSRTEGRTVLDDKGQPKPASSPFPELEKTLREVLKADGVAENQVTLAFHEKTNVLVVNSTEAVHLLVNQLLQALEQNVGQTTAFQRMIKLQTDLADRDKELRELQRGLRQLQNPPPKLPSAK